MHWRLTMHVSTKKGFHSHELARSTEPSRAILILITLVNLLYLFIELYLLIVSKQAIELSILLSTALEFFSEKLAMTMIKWLGLLAC